MFVALISRSSRAPRAHPRHRAGADPDPEPEGLVEAGQALAGGRAKELRGRPPAWIDEQAVTQFVSLPLRGQAQATDSGWDLGAFGTVFNLLLMLIISIYLLLDQESSRALLGAIPETVRDHAVELFYAVERTLIKYLRGQFVLCTIMGVIGWP